ncbi:MAG TPA: acyl-CoA desaturase, partial [Myxococcales bacterium]|nr:acyl-CoA desaturase [Myxococcales bacterium]
MPTITEAIPTPQPHLAREDRVDWRATIPYALFHVAAIVGAIVFHPRPWDLALMGFMYLARMAAVTGGYHRYFSHRSYSTSRAFQFLLALWGSTAMQQGPLWWASVHRHHHRYSDQPEDVHSPSQRGFWWAHMGWIFSPRFAKTRLELVPDLARYPELRWLDRNWLVPQVGLAAL